MYFHLQHLGTRSFQSCLPRLSGGGDLFIGIMYFPRQKKTAMAKSQLEIQHTVDIIYILYLYAYNIDNTGITS